MMPRRSNCMAEVFVKKWSTRWGEYVLESLHQSRTVVTEKWKLKTPPVPMPMKTTMKSKKTAKQHQKTAMKAMKTTMKSKKAAMKAMKTTTMTSKKKTATKKPNK